MTIDINLITGALGFLFTVLVFSYLLGDNLLFRIGTYIFVGVTAGYVASVAMWQVVYPRLIYPLVYGSPTPSSARAPCSSGPGSRSWAWR